jgi:hypothetical protein
MTNKEKAELLLKLLEGQMAHFNQTRSLEFKINLSLWTVIVLAGKFLYGKIYLNNFCSLLLFVAISLLVVFGHLYWMNAIQKSENLDQKFVLEYRKRVEKLVEDIEISNDTEAHIKERGEVWRKMEVGFTVILLLILGILLSVNSIFVGLKCHAL